MVRHLNKTFNAAISLEISTRMGGDENTPPLIIDTFILKNKVNRFFDRSQKQFLEVLLKWSYVSAHVYHLLSWPGHFV